MRTTRWSDMIYRVNINRELRWIVVAIAVATVMIAGSVNRVN